MLKKLLIITLFLTCGLAAFGQEKLRLGILPFTGGLDRDGETVATLLSFQSDILGAFTVVPRTSAVNALLAEQNFQMMGYTDSDTISRLGRLLNADFVVSGHIRRLGNRNLVITTIVNVETFELLAGDYREYQNIEEVRRMLPAISRKMIAATQRDSSKLPKLAIAPFNIANKNVNTIDAEVLAQILSIEITNIGTLAVLPRTATMQAALQELEYQLAGYTAEEEAKTLGMATNANYVLSAEVRSLGSINMFTAQILHVEDGRLMRGNSRDYQTVSDGIHLMKELATVLIGGSEPPTSNKSTRDNRATTVADPAKFWSMGASVGTSFATPLFIGTVHGTIAPFPYSFLEIGLDLGFISNTEDILCFSLYPFAHYVFFLPFPEKGGWYIGAGGGYMLPVYLVDRELVLKDTPAFDLTTGFNIWNLFNISYTLRTNFKKANNKVSAGFVKRY